jgi:hypothetical protein
MQDETYNSRDISVIKTPLRNGHLYSQDREGILILKKNSGKQISVM